MAGYAECLSIFWTVRLLGKHRRQVKDGQSTLKNQASFFKWYEAQ